LAPNVILAEKPSDLEGLSLRGVLGVDAETTGLGRKARLVSLQVSDEVTTVVLDARRVSPIPLLTRMCGKDWIFQNGKFDLWFLIPYLDEITGQEPWTAWKSIWDTMLAEQVLAGGLPRAANLEALAYRYARIRLDKGEQTAFVQRKGESDEEYAARMSQPFTQAQVDYMSGDVRLLPLIKRAQTLALQQNNLTAVARLEMDLMPVLADMERIGARVDVPAIQALIEELTTEIEIRERSLVDVLTPHVLEWRAARWEQGEARIRAYDEKAEIQKRALEQTFASVFFERQAERRAAINAQMKAWREANKRPSHVKYSEGPINPASDDQVLVALQHMGIELKNTKADTLLLVKQMVEDEVVAGAISDLLDFRHMGKLKGSTLEKILEFRDELDRVHPSIHQMVRTGRMSMSEPNLQNIPVRTELGKRCRRCFIPDEGNVLISGDYSQIELRVLAEDIYKRTGDRTMLDMFLRGEDVHASTAAQMYEVELATVLDEHHANHKLRRDAKVINFGLVYGMTETGLSRDLHCSKAEARKKRGRHFQIHKGVPKWMEEVTAEAQYRGYASTMLGRRRYFPAIEGDLTYWEEKVFREAIERQAMNTPIQGTAADIMKLGLIENWKQIRSFAWQINVVHDETVEETRREAGEMVAHITREALIGAGQTVLKVCPVDVEMEIGETWS
jgi:DNA polymerase I-like protein with 3'-5' exonuclease and polymerase domains